MSNLLRGAGSGAPTGAQTARELVERGTENGGLNATEAATARELLSKPDVREAVGPEMTKQLTQMAREQEAPQRDVAMLLPNFEKLMNASSLASRFATDFKLIKSPLLDFPGLTHQQQAQRLTEFVGAYAERFATLTEFMPPAEKQQLIGEFMTALREAGMHEVVDLRTGEDGLQMATRLLESMSAAESRGKRTEMDPDAPTWKDNPAASANKKHIDLGFSSARLTGQQRAFNPKGDEMEDAPGHKKGRSGQLGANPLWNALHTMRDGDGEDPSELEQRDTLNRIIVAAALLFIFAAVVAIVLVMLE